MEEINRSRGRGESCEIKTIKHHQRRSSVSPSNGPQKYSKILNNFF